MTQSHQTIVSSTRGCHIYRALWGSKSPRQTRLPRQRTAKLRKSFTRKSFMARFRKAQIGAKTPLQFTRNSRQIFVYIWRSGVCFAKISHIHGLRTAILNMKTFVHRFRNYSAVPKISRFCHCEEPFPRRRPAPAALGR